MRSRSEKVAAPVLSASRLRTSISIPRDWNRWCGVASGCTQRPRITS